MKLGATLAETQRVVMGRLIPLKPRWLAGTDAAGYDFNIMGYALLEELRLLQEHGLSPVDAVRAATTEPAAAMRQATEFGAIAKGMRADCVLLRDNPLEDASAYRVNAGVMAHGVWLSRAALDKALASLAAAYALPDERASLSRASLASLGRDAAALVAAGFVFDPEVLRAAASAFAELGLQPEANLVSSLAVEADVGPCALEMPK
jgi:hypothetical protein